ncbi:kelch domain-containing protein 4 [Prorops nasuta]|uniref:kelch domain-containing protein 4 n=1 Tax=Prorops nasuta TaxID=863751 RepID=UPI0034CF5163
MGKKNKKKNKISGMDKTVMKTEKKLTAKQKKELAALGEEDIEKVIAEIEREESRRQRVLEAIVEHPSRRVNFTISSHPYKEELIIFGGEFHDGKQTIVYGDLFFYNLNKNEWKVVKAPNAPPPRCGHQAAVTNTDKGELWIFGGEFSSPSESQFYHYKDLWVFRIGDKKWEKIIAAGGPSARSGHRMAYFKKQLIIFGGFYDNLRDYKYYNDVYIFNIDTYKWHKIEPAGNAPCPRSGCMIFPTPDNKILVYGGYSKEKVQKDIDKGHIHSDMFLLVPAKNDQTGLQWKWTSVKQTGAYVSPRCSATGILVQPNMAYIFGGVYDEEESEEELHGKFYNDLFALDLEKYQWHIVNLTGKRDQTASHKKKKPREKSNDKHDKMEDSDEGSNNADNENDDIDSCKESPVITTPSTNAIITEALTNEDDIFTVTIGPKIASSSCKNEKLLKETLFLPCPRINPGLAIKRNILYLYGGLFEDENKEYTLNDFYALDFRKQDEWKTIVSDDLSSQTWYESSSDTEQDDDEEDDNSDDSSCETDENKMETE